MGVTPAGAGAAQDARRFQETTGTHVDIAGILSSTSVRVPWSCLPIQLSGQNYAGFLCALTALKLLLMIPLQTCRYVQWGDGSSQWSNLPISLHNELMTRQIGMPGVKFLSVGLNGGWVIGFRDGGWVFWDIPESMDKAMNHIHEDSGIVVAADLGANDDWVLVYAHWGFSKLTGSETTCTRVDSLNSTGRDAGGSVAQH